MTLFGHYRSKIRHATAEQISAAIRRVWAEDHHGFLILKDESDRNISFIQICFDSKYGGFCVEVQRSMPRSQYRLNRPASEVEANALFTGFILRGLGVMDEGK